MVTKYNLITKMIITHPTEMRLLAIKFQSNRVFLNTKDTQAKKYLPTT